MQLVYVIGPANPEVVVGFLAFALIVGIVGGIFMYLGLTATAGSLLVLLLNFAVVPYLFYRAIKNTKKGRWLRVLLCVALVPVVGAFTYNESKLNYHSDSLFTADEGNDTPLSRIKYATPPSWQGRFVNSPGQLAFVTGLFGSYGLTLARLDPTLDDYMRLATFQRVCVTRKDTGDNVSDWQKLRSTVYERAGLPYIRQVDAASACSSNEAIQRTFGIDFAKLLADELQTSREYYAKAVAMGSGLIAACPPDNKQSCSRYGLTVTFTTDDGPVLGCSNREGCAEITVPDPTINVGPGFFANARGNGAQIYANWQHNIALLKGDANDDCFGTVCAVTRGWFKR